MFSNEQIVLGLLLIGLFFILTKNFALFQHQIGGAAREGQPCDPTVPCNPGLVCFGKDQRGVCVYPKTDEFGLE